MPFKLTPKQAREKWLKALRSGSYRQGQKALCQIPEGPNVEPKHCCLGVACELFAQEEGNLKVGTHSPVGCITVPVRTYGSTDEYSWLPFEVMAWLGLNDRRGSANGDAITPTPTSSKKYSCLGAANDTGLPFPEIAEMIETNQDKLFRSEEATLELQAQLR